MRRVLSALVIVVVLGALLASTVLAAGPVSATLYVGQNEIAGYVKIWEDETAGVLHVEYWMKRGYCLTETAVHVADEVDDFPTSNGGAIPGQFDYKQDPDGCVAKVTYAIPLAGGYANNDIYIAVHAVVITPTGEETGWAVRCGDLENTQFDGPNWSAYIWFPLGLHTTAPN